MNRSPSVAIVHEWLVDHSGSEKVLEQILQVFPDATLFAVVEFLPKELKYFILNKTVTTTFIQKLPFARKSYRSYFPLMPYAVEQLDVSKYDIVLTSNHAVSKGVLTHSDQLHICYCHSPIRYAWDLYHQYIDQSGLRSGLKGLIAKLSLHYLRMWDVAASNRVDHYIANSHFIAKRIQRIYRRDSHVIHPPVDVEQFQMRDLKDDFYLTASRFVPYKRVDLIIEAFVAMPDKHLVVIGDGPEYKKLSAVKADNITFLGFQPFEVLKDHMQRARAFVFAAIEDFGITPVEAMACGTPVIAFAKGGALETVMPNISGILYHEQSVSALCAAIEDFENKSNFDAREIRAWAERFGQERFRKEFDIFIKHMYSNFIGKNNV